eukprot:Anaeramoba_ignava/c20857_g1_i1.p1 GENE.c20857_g1_i1~~c20857_g1_i1.p1  ORF type:complete len:1534 (+),score=438.75 c20857_g1_i1:501-4604(+)
MENGGSSFDLRPLFETLKYTQWFTEIRIEGPQRKETIKLLANAVETNTAMKIIVIQNTGCTTGFSELGQAMIKNTKLALETLEILGHKLKTKSAALIAEAAGKLGTLKVLKLNNCMINSKTLGSMMNKLKANDSLFPQLSCLDLGHNEIGKSGTKTVVKVLEKMANKRTENIPISLFFGNTNLDLEPFLSVLENKLKKFVRALDISGNRLEKPESAEKLVKFVIGSDSLRHLNISQTGIKVEEFAKIFEHVARKSKTQFALYASGNSLGEKGAKILCKYLPDCKQLVKLHIDDNAFGAEGVTEIIDILCQNSHLQRLSISNNLGENEDKKKLSLVGKKLSALVSTTTSITEICMKGSRNRCLGEYLVPSLKSLVFNKTIKVLNIEGNFIQEQGIRTLCDMLKKNKTLQKVYWDANGSTVASIEAFLEMLSVNSSLIESPFPESDFANEKNSNVLNSLLSLREKIEEKLILNLRGSPDEYSNSKRSNRKINSILEKKSFQHFERLARVPTDPTAVDQEESNTGNTTTTSSIAITGLSPRPNKPKTTTTKPIAISIKAVETSPNTSKASSLRQKTSQLVTRNRSTTQMGNSLVDPRFGDNTSINIISGKNKNNGNEEKISLSKIQGMRHTTFAAWDTKTRSPKEKRSPRSTLFLQTSSPVSPTMSGQDAFSPNSEITNEKTNEKNANIPEKIKNILQKGDLKQLQKKQKALRMLSKMCEPQTNNTVLHYAAQSGKAEVLSWLLQKDEMPELVNARNANGMTPLHMLFTAQKETIEAVVLLCDFGAEISAKDSNELTALDHCINNYSISERPTLLADVMAVLLEKGADPNLVDSRRRTPLHRAAANGFLKGIKLLLEFESYINATDINNSTPLHESAKNGHPVCVRVLLKRGASYTRVDSESHTALDLARIYHQSACEKILEPLYSSNNTKNQTPNNQSRLLSPPSEFNRKNILHSIPKSKIFRVALLGPSRAGKTQLAHRFTSNSFSTNYSAILSSCFKKLVPFHGDQVLLKILDTSGSYHLSGLIYKWIQSSDGFILAYNCSHSKDQSFQQIEDVYFKKIKEIKGRSFPVVLTALGIDTPNRQVTMTDGQMLAEKLKCPFIETSAKKAQNVDLLFQTILEEMWVILNREEQLKNEELDILRHRLKAREERKKQRTELSKSAQQSPPNGNANSHANANSNTHANANSNTHANANSNTNIDETSELTQEIIAKSSLEVRKYTVFKKKSHAVLIQSPNETTKRIPFPEILANQTYIAFFEEFLKSEYCDENLMFYVSVQNMKTLDEDDNELLVLAAKDIYDTYISSESQFEININFEIRNTITEKIHSKIFTKHIFDSAQQAIRQLLERDSYPRFLKSPSYQKLLSSLEEK